jgi:uncharacterized membrane protein YqjE
MQTRTEFDKRIGADMQRESFGELISQLANNSAALVRDEIDLVKQEMREKISRLRSAVTLIAIGAVVGLFAVLALMAAAIIGLGHLVGMGVSALIIGIVLAVAAAIPVFSGLGQLKRTNLKPEQTMETLEEDKEWLKQLT